MVTCVLIPVGPGCADIEGIRAGDLNLITGHLHHSGTPVDLTGQTIRAQARLTKLTPDPPALTAVVVITAPLTGDFTFRWDGDDVRTLLGAAAKWKGVWDIEVDNGVDDPVTFCTGKFSAEMDVTR